MHVQLSYFCGECLSVEVAFWAADSGFSLLQDVSFVIFFVEEIFGVLINVYLYYNYFIFYVTCFLQTI